MRWTRVFAVGLVLSCLAVAPGWSSASAAQPSAGALMAREINKARAHRGLWPLRRSRALHRSASAFARWQMSRDVFGHLPTMRISSRYSRRGEALAWHRGKRARIRRTVRAWLGSPSHRRLVLTRSMDLVGAGLSKGRLGRGRAVIWVLHLGWR